MANYEQHNRLGEAEISLLHRLARSVERYAEENELDTNKKNHSREYYFDAIKTLYWELNVVGVLDMLSYYEMVQILARQMF
jgi:hypothetical protein